MKLFVDTSKLDEPKSRSKEESRDQQTICGKMPAGGSLGKFGQVGRRTEGWELEVLVLNLVLVLVTSCPAVSVCTSPIEGSIA